MNLYNVIVLSMCLGIFSLSVNGVDSTNEILRLDTSVNGIDSTNEVLRLESSVNGTDSTNEVLRLEASVKEKYAQLIKGLEKFANSRDCDELDRIHAIIESLWDGNRQKGVSWKNRRCLKLQSWLLSLDVLEKSIDKDFNADDVPEENIAPPLVEGAVLDSGIRPDAIKDPKVREQYKLAIKANDVKAERYRFQNKLRKLDRDWSSNVSTFIKNHYSSQSQDINEVNTLIDKFLSSTLKREQMKSVLLITE